MLPGGVPAEQTTRTHKIIDGDTLPSLAQRYLGSSQRAKEIYDANRDVLLDPQLLPIGAVLKIPPRGRRSESSEPPSGVMPSPPLSPVSRP